MLGARQLDNLKGDIEALGGAFDTAYETNADDKLTMILLCPSAAARVPPHGTLGLTRRGLARSPKTGSSRAGGL